MSFKRLTPSDFLVSADSVTAPCWTNNVYNLTTFFTSSTQEASSQGDYVLAVYQTASSDDTAAIQFYIGYCDANGSGSTAYNSAIPNLSPSSTLYGQYRNLILEDENSNFIFGDVSSSQFFALSVERANYKQSLFPGSLNLTLSGSSANSTIRLTDNSNDISVVPYINGTRVYQIVTGSNGNATSTPSGATTVGYTISGSYGWFVPDMGTIILNAKALQLPVANGGIALAPSTGSSAVANGTNNALMYATINRGVSFQLNSQENITSDYVFIRPQNSEFNYTTNPSFISGSTGEVIYPTFINNPQTYITTVGLYNDTNELLAVAKLSRPLVKDFTKEALIRVKLDF